LSDLEFVCLAGFALFKLQDEGLLKSPEKLYHQFEKIESAKKLCVTSVWNVFTLRVSGYYGFPVC